jgi:hypothetical protein
MWSRVRLLGVISLCFALGCNRSSDGLDKLQPVKGKVVFNGKSIATGNVRSVMLRPDAEKGNTSPHEPRGEIDKDGNFEIFTANRRGAPPGHYKVAVSIMESPLPDSTNMYAAPKWLIDAKYGDPETSGLTLNVVEKPANGAYDLTIEVK